MSHVLLLLITGSAAKHTDFVRGVAWNKEGKREYMSGGWSVLSDGTLDVKLHSGF